MEIRTNTKKKIIMKPLRDLIFIQQEDSVKETVTPGGIVLLSTQNNRFQIGDQETVLQELIKKPKTNKGKVLAIGNSCKIYKEGDTVIYKKKAEVANVDHEGIIGVMVKENDVLVSCVGNSFNVHPDFVLIKIKREEREALYNKKIRREDGEEVVLFIQGDKGKDDADSNSIFVGFGEITAVGKNLKNIEKGDIGLISYLCDNDESIIVGYDGVDKIIAVKAITTRHKEKLMSYASRKPVLDNKGKQVYKDGKLQVYNRDRIVFEKGDYDELSSLYGVVRDRELIAIEPYCFLEHKETKVMKVGRGGIITEEDEKIIQRKILSLSEESTDRIGVNISDNCLMDDFDVFICEVGGSKVSVINDIDLLGVVK